ncbi:MAG TPA: hypothetical protein VFQ05_17625 [Candidatus Eisenbacteria bacterium]|nr:hypothetical protein [Candidatus Eisenbacteria bacterium]
MSVVDAQTSWFAKAESEIKTLKDVESASIQGEGDVIHEIHVLTRSNRPPKQIVRDVQAVLHNRFKRSIDYRVVSVAYLSSDATKPDHTAGNGTASAPAAEPAKPAPVEAQRPAVAKVVEAAPAPASRPAPLEERIRFGGVNLYVSGPRTQAQVELLWRNLPRMGTAAGWSTRSGAHRLVAQATLSAVQEFLADELALGLMDVEFLRLGKKRAVVVSLSMLVERQEKILVGTCVIEPDLHQAVVFATLAALNRLVGGLRPKEPTEYVLRPTSVK